MPFVVYSKETGAILCTKKMRPMNLPDGYDFILSALPLDPNACHVEHGRIVPLGLRSRVAAQKQAGWFEFRRERKRRLDETDHMMMPDYPLSDRERLALTAKRKASRDIPQKTTNPNLALQTLETIWSDSQ